MADRDERNLLAAALLQAIRDARLGDPKGAFDITAALDALSLTTATVLSQLPAARVDEIARAIADVLVSDILRRMREVRAFCDETGLRPFDDSDPSSGGEPARG